MTRYTFYCPHCKEVLESTTVWHTDYGSPLRQCPKCNKIYCDKRSREIAIQGIPFLDKYFCLSWFLLILYVAPILHLFNYHDSQTFFGFIIISVLVLPIVFWRSHAYYKKRKQYFEKKMEESVKRLSDYGYATALSKCGYKVPEKFLRSPSSGESAYAEFMADKAKSADLAKEKRREKYKSVYSVLNVKNIVKLAVFSSLSLFFLFMSFVSFLVMRDGQSYEDASYNDAFIFVIVMFTVFILLFIISVRERLFLKNYIKYKLIIDNNHVYSIDMIASETGIQAKTVTKELNRMIKKHMFLDAKLDIEANKIIFDN